MKRFEWGKNLICFSFPFCLSYPFSSYLPFCYSFLSVFLSPSIFFCLLLFISFLFFYPLLSFSSLLLFFLLHDLISFASHGWSIFNKKGVFLFIFFAEILFPFFCYFFSFAIFLLFSFLFFENDPSLSATILLFGTYLNFAGL